MARWGIRSADFDAAIRQHTSDEAVARWVHERVPAASIHRANDWLLTAKRANLDRQDAEEMG